MKETAVNKLPYPEVADSPNGAAQIKALADALDVLKWGSRNLKPTMGVVQATSNLTLTESYADVAGGVLEITPAVASLLKITTIFRFTGVGEAGSGVSMVGTVKLDAAAEEARVAASNAHSGGAESQATVSQVHLLSLTAAKHTIKLRAKKFGGGGTTGLLVAADTCFMYELVAS